MIIRHRYEEQDGKQDAIAHAEVDEHDGVLWLTNVWAHPDHRQCGHASALVEAAIRQWAHRDVYLSVCAYTDQPLSAEQLERFYASFGFEPTTVPGVMHRKAKPFYGRASVPPEPANEPAKIGWLRSLRRD